MHECDLMGSPTVSMPQRMCVEPGSAFVLTVCGPCLTSICGKVKGSALQHMLKQSTVKGDGAAP